MNTMAVVVGIGWAWSVIPVDICLVVCYAIVIPIFIKVAPHKSYFHGRKLHDVMLSYNADRTSTTRTAATWGAAKCTSPR